MRNQSCKDLIKNTAEIEANKINVAVIATDRNK